MRHTLDSFCSERPALVLLTVLSGCWWTACTPHAYSPPARIAPLDTARTLDDGATSTELAGGFFSELFDVEGELVSVRVRRGISDSVEIGGDATLIHISSTGSGDTHPNIYEGRAHMKWSPVWAEDIVALTAGVGGGASAAGGFVSPDLGLNVAYENRYIVPFVTGSVLVSVPVGASAVDLSLEDDDPGTDMQTPITTWGAVVGGGIRVPVRFGPDEDQHKGSLALGVSWTWLNDGEDDSTIPAIAPGIELVY